MAEFHLFTSCVRISNDYIYDDVVVITIRSKLRDVETQRTSKLALFKQGMDISLALAIKDVN